MPSVSIQLPNINADHVVEIQVKINGESKRYNYRIEVFHWDECKKEQSHAECLRDILSHYDKNWQMIQICSADDKNVPIMFRQVN
jgi:hypothetical protein